VLHGPLSVPGIGLLTVWLLWTVRRHGTN
jgi:hypothetical protein